MRYRPIFLAVVALAFTACSDNAPTGATLRAHRGPMSQLSLADYIQEQIEVLLPKGFESSVDARWSTVRQKKEAGDLAGAIQHLNSLSTWIDKKTNDITPPVGMTKAQGAALLVINMARWVHEGENAPVVEVPTGDVVLEVVTSGAPLFMQTPSLHAGVSWGGGSTNQDVIVTLIKDPTPYDGHCNGPLPTKRCQYPLFYNLHIYPQVPLSQAGKFAVCLVKTGDRRPLEYLADEANGSRPVDRRLRLAHTKPADPAHYTPGSTREDGIEILPLSQMQTGELIHCDAPNTLAMNRVVRALYTASRFAAKFISPEKAYAYDSGPEHDFTFTSPFNGVDPASQPDLSASPITAPASGEVGTSVTASFVVENTSRRMGGHATAAADATTAALWLSSDQTVGGGDIALGSESIAMRRPDESSTVTKTFNLPATGGSYYLIAAVAENGSYTGEISGANNTRSLAITVVDLEIPLTLNLASVEKLPGGTQRFSVTSGSPGPYIWSVNGVDGGNATYGTIVPQVDFADYTAPSAVPTPATFDVCARRQAKPSNKACATVTIKPVPSASADIVVFNDLNVFDGNALGINNQMFRNIANFTATGPRASQTKVLIYRGHNSSCQSDWRFGGTSFCGTAQLAPLSNALTAAGFTVVNETNQAARLPSIAADIKAIMLFNPTVAFSNAEINVLKAFAGEGGRVVFVGEHFGYYGPWIEPVQNDFLAKMGAVLRNRGNTGGTGIYACPATVSGTNVKEHQLTQSVTQARFACSSEVQLGANDYAIFTHFQQNALRVLTAVAKIDLTPLPVTLASVSTRSAILGDASAATPPAGPDVPDWIPDPE